VITVEKRVRKLFTLAINLVNLPESGNNTMDEPFERVKWHGKKSNNRRKGS
jgi:hypothetical protein